MRTASQPRRRARRALLAVACAVLVLPGTTGAERGGGEPPEARAAALPTPPIAPPPLERDVAYLGAGRPTLDVHRPARGARRAPAVLVVHGGAWSAGDKSAIGHVARALADAGFVAINVNYTLAGPGRPGYPTQVEELAMAVEWVRRHAATLGVDPARVGAFGVSAGAHLAALLATSSTGRLDAGRRLRAVVAWSPPTNLADPRLRLGHKVAGFLGCHPCPRRAAAASPVAHVSPDDPPMLIVNSRRELVPLTQARRLAGRLAAAGVRRKLLVLPGRLHAPRYSASALAPSISFLRRRLHH